MAIGDSYSGNSSSNSNNRLYDNTYYSRLRFRGTDHSLSIYYRSGLMCLEVYDLEENTYKVLPKCNIFLSPTKANILSHEIKSFKEYLQRDDVKENVAFGVNGGMGEKVSYIGFHTNKNKDINITIGKFDDKGQIIESYTVTLPKDYNYGLEWKDISAMDIEKVYHNGIELEMIHNAITDFGRSMSGASAYSGLDLGRYDTARILRKMDPIYDKLGIERKYTGNGGAVNNNFLNNASASTSSRSTTIDEMEDLLE
ncbi:MAG: hypothetical protein IKR19_08280 [Acholeplasmatales bacterium]|nr:hypothetical protein [Acholeplasmatales bacterium]